MAQDKLFLLKPDFDDGGEKWFCPGCAQVEGMLSFFPQLREKLDIKYIDFPRPRPAVVELVGPDNQGCPVLVLAGPPLTGPFEVKDYNGTKFLNEPRDIQEYLAAACGVPRPH